MFEAIEAQVQALPQWVQVWTNWMMLAFLASLLFVRRHRTARFAFGAILLTLPLALLIFSIHPNIYLFGIAHLAVWLPLLLFVLIPEIRRPGFSGTSAFGIWALLLSATIATSLVFDVRDVILVLLGKR